MPELEKPSIFVGVDYDEYKPGTYRGYYVQFEQLWKIAFNTKSPVRDKDMAYAFARTFPGCNVLTLSSADNFYADAMNYFGTGQMKPEETTVVV